MKLSYQWLKKSLGIKESPEELARLLTMQVAQVEDVEHFSYDLSQVISVKIVEVKPHPNADKLKIATVIFKDKQKKEQKLEIVCGAPNIQVGQIVPLALPGVKLSDGIEIKESVIRGIKSPGMLCAEDELGIGSDHNGILILPSGTKLGQSISEIFELNDAILEVENKSITHRPDLFSINGFIKEIAAIKNIKLTPIKLINWPRVNQDKTGLKIKVENSKACPRYMAVVMEISKMGPSPLWMQNKLRKLGIRPINNIVDITNYILLEDGQPLHAFDFDKVKISPDKSKNVLIRLAKSGEKIFALDGKTYELQNTDLVIADHGGPVALAGIMGGEQSGIDSKTKRIMIEAALFEPATIRRTSWRLGMRTEAVLRFEKGLPSIFPETGLKRAVELITELAGGKLISKIYDIQSPQIKKTLRTKKTISLSVKWVEQIIGATLGIKQITNILKSLGFVVKSSGQQKISVLVPQHRPDIEIAEDVIEDIVRVYGSEKIIPQPIRGDLRPIDYEKNYLLEKKLKDLLSKLGFDEAYNYSFYGEKIINQLKLKTSDHLVLANPLSPQLKYLRLSLLPYLLENTVKNSASFSPIKIFEIGHVYQKGEDNSTKEERYCSVLINEKNKKLFYTLKSMAENILNRAGFSKERISFQEGKNHQYQYLKKLIGIFVDQKLVGVMGEIDETIKTTLKLNDNLSFFEINLDTLASLNSPAKVFQTISPYPPVLRDLSLLVEKKIVLSELLRVIKDFHPLIAEVEPFDIFESEKIGLNIRNVAFHLTFQSFEKTLAAGEIDQIMERLIKLLGERFGAKLRNF